MGHYFGEIYPDLADEQARRRKLTDQCKALQEELIVLKASKFTLKEIQDVFYKADSSDDNSELFTNLTKLKARVMINYRKAY